MMHMITFLKGCGIGFTVAAIVGPIALLCIRRTITDGQAVGLAIGLGAALADATYGLIAGFGLHVVSDFLLDHQFIFRICGSFFLLYLGITTFLEQPANTIANVQAHSLAKLTGSIFLLTLSNPVTILSFMAIFAGLGIDADVLNYTKAFLLVFGIFLGSMLWFTLLTTFLRYVRTKISGRVIGIINKTSGVLITAFGVAGLVSLLLIKN